jgi:hypothetical protein
MTIVSSTFKLYRTVRRGGRSRMMAADAYVGISGYMLRDHDTEEEVSGIAITLRGDNADFALIMTEEDAEKVADRLLEALARRRFRRGTDVE